MLVRVWGGGKKFKIKMIMLPYIVLTFLLTIYLFIFVSQKKKALEQITILCH
jgi:hypothetical protein